MRAITVPAFGPATVLTPSDVATPVPGPGQLLVEVSGAGVGPWDAKARRGQFGPRDFPYIPGNEVSGIVSATNGETGGIAVGDLVFGSTDGTGGYAEYVVVDATRLAPAPRQVDLEAAGAVPVGGVTAIEGIDEHLHLNAGESVLVTGAAGGVGHFVVQVARARDARVIATASPNHHDFVRSLGADEVVDYHSDWVTAVRGVDAAFDCVGGDTWIRCLQTIRDGGRAVTIAAFDRVEGHDRVTTSAFRVSITRDRLTEVAGIIDAGRASVAISERLPLDEAVRAHEIIEAGHTRGKLILIPG
jgi:NADPH:quinone reductase-like Zn-dependent oxidoreductase